MVRSLIGALLFFVTLTATQADTVEHDYEAVMHVRSTHALPILDNPSHVVGIAEFRGLAIFVEGEIAIHRYDGWFDIDKGSGKFHGYASWTFEDGSEIRAPYSGTARSSGTDGVQVEAQFENITGTGRFEGATGSGGFKGRRLDAIDKGGSTYLKGKLTITTP
ncbi:MAG: hypothetical protein GY789_30595 [Hyphomicrobiales bacterium]|nr:hypothetical protein [Hyphomicrobiales bacterium]MCP4997632.1 hypothetical protein [Hyphomicrobiales bacterium]